MHSVFVHLVNFTRAEIADWLGSRSLKGLREHWYVPNRNDPVFSVRFPHSGSEYQSPDNHRGVTEVMGREADTHVQFDVGGKHPGHKELRVFLVELLTEFSGVAVDDLSPHVWTLDELRENKLVNGYAFADHDSFRRAHGAHHTSSSKH